MAKVMPTTFEMATERVSWRERLFRKVVLHIFAQMERGSLRLTLPEGDVLEFGNGDGSGRASIHIKNEAFFRKCVLSGDIGFGESYMDGDWETDSITNVIAWMILNYENLPTIAGSKNRVLGVNLFGIANRLLHMFRPNSKAGSKRNITAHYDLSNDFFRTFLDPSMTYSSAYFAQSDLDLAAAQREKYDRLCQKLKIGPDDHVLEIGSGWGGFAMYAVQNYGCRVTTVTISEQQYDLARKRIAEAGLSDRIELLLTDYRELKGRRFDKIVSIEMLEAVGHKYLPVYFKKCQELLKADGALGLQVITSPDSRYDDLRKGVDWIQKHIFPGTLLPSIAAINGAINKTGDLFLHDLHDMGLHYSRTLATWRETFNRNINRVRALGFDDVFIRKWNYYFSYCEAAFKMRHINVVQMVYVRPNNTKF